MLMCILFCCVYNGQISPKITKSSLQVLKKLPVCDKVIKLAHFVHFVLKFTGKLVLCK